jgi:hypothetical protein
MYFVHLGYRTNAFGASLLTDYAVSIHSVTGTIFMSITIRAAEKADVSTILHFINALALFEKEPDAVFNSVEEIERRLFGEEVHAHGLICEKDGEAIGFAVYFFQLFHLAREIWFVLRGSLYRSKFSWNRGR